jgi:hypothetical protein
MTGKIKKTNDLFKSDGFSIILFKSIESENLSFQTNKNIKFGKFVHYFLKIQ